MHTGLIRYSMTGLCFQPAFYQTARYPGLPGDSHRFGDRRDSPVAPSLDSPSEWLKTGVTRK